MDLWDPLDMRAVDNTSHDDPSPRGRAPGGDNGVTHSHPQDELTGGRLVLWAIWGVREYG